MNKKKETLAQKQLKVINEKMDQILEDMIDFNNSRMKALLELSSLLQNLAAGETDTNERLLRK